MQISHISIISMLSFSMYTLALPAPNPEVTSGMGAGAITLQARSPSEAVTPETKGLENKLEVDGKKEEIKTTPGLAENELKKKSKEDEKHKVPGATSGNIPDICLPFIKETPPAKTPPKITPPKITPPVKEAPKKPESPPKKSSAVSAQIQGSQAVFATAFSSSVLVYAIAAVLL